jgi:predicted nucleic acid-binding protein
MLLVDTSVWVHALKPAGSCAVGGRLEPRGTLRRHGITVTASDCFIATVAILQQATLVHCDSDFETIRAWLPLRVGAS